jgi:hypothetical protein
MNDIEVRMQCLRLALSKNGPSEAVALAGKMAEFALGAIPLSPILSSSSGDMLREAFRIGFNRRCCALEMDCFFSCWTIPRRESIGNSFARIAAYD